ncbi:hypothetical protein DPEC_G00337630 [Dallia pectoralis]|uniref:Uncharacterized protein n=1 Tax=Dallia pectoralis TaxID=75939 RepID=A0ACC2F475_DALPE|nr:hypothetical protein DPEC_G00337630 [Dallia pectoralis]
MVYNDSVPQAPPPSPTPAQVGAGGRSSGRKRTPKACDCCGPNSKHHDGKTPSGKPRQRRGQLGKGRCQTVGETPKRKVGRPPAMKTSMTEEQVAATQEEVEKRTVLEEVADSDMDPEQTREGAFCEGEQACLEKEPEASSDKSLLSKNKSKLLKQPRSRSSETVVSFNGSSSVHKEEPTDCCTPMEVEPSATACVSPGIIMLSTFHPFALWDHRDYCKLGVWASCTEPEVDPTQLTKPSSQYEDSFQLGIKDIIHEFLEVFYLKYGSFIPLSETDIIEHLKNKCISGISDKKLNINSEVVRYKAALASTPMNIFKVDYNKHTLTLEDLSTLDYQNWVNDQVINMYGELIMEAVQHKVHFFNSFFHRQLVAKGYEGVKRWTKKVDLFSKRLLLIPIHLEIHWSLITVDITSRHIHYYDSQGMVFKYTMENIMRYIMAEAKEKKLAGYQKGWKMIINKGIPQQKNDSDCGVFVLEYCKCLALKEPLEFTQNDMPKVRKRIYKELCDCKLIQ